MSSTIHPTRLSQIPRSKPSKPRRQKPSKPQPASTSLTRSQLRKKIRDLTRLLNPSSSSTKLPATTRIDHERALSAYKHELSLQQTSSKAHLLEKRYHKVRFFERRKATRSLTRLNRELNALSTTSTIPSDSDSDSKRDEITKKIHEAEVDLNYIMHYPPLEKYISLYKSGDNKDTNQKRERIRRDIEKRMEDGTLHRGHALVEANAAEGFGGASTVGGKNKKNNNNDKKQGDKNGKSMSDQKQEDEDEDEGSDGGFFES
ncbi:18S rRNA maturation protein [Arthrobotrys conoides]|uniref:rRNA-processing protein EFG1 n=1 Tax=Arthrobotrys conoides TaxID=74498 RepID=A0AAN8NMJ6_9PEZI